MSDDTVRFRVAWDGFNWVAELAGGGVTQARNLDRLRANCVEVVALMLDRDVSVEDIALDISVDVPGVDPDIAQTIRALRNDFELLSDRLSATTTSTVKTLASKGFPMRDISEVVGVSHQRVGQILAGLGRQRPRVRKRPPNLRYKDPPVG